MHSDHGTVGRQVTEVNGVEVLAREPAHGPHPRTHRDAIFSGVTHLLLADNTELYSCDNCSFTAATTLSVVSHRSNTHNRTAPARPGIGEKEARRALAVMAEERAAGRRGWAQRSANRLNDLQIKASHGLWSATAVSQFHHQWAAIYPVRVRRAVVPAPRSGNDPAAIKAEIVRLVTLVLNLIAELPDAAADPALIEKAAKWDRVSQLFGGAS